MSESNEPREEFHLPITLTVGERQIEVPLVVSLTFPELAAIVRSHLENGTDVYGALLERYADGVRGKQKPAPTRTHTVNGDAPKRPRKPKPAPASG
jgi:hypothetical protein